MNSSIEKGSDAIQTTQVISENPAITRLNNKNDAKKGPVHFSQGVTEIKGPSRVQYVPFQRTVIEYQPVETIQYVPIQKKVIQYQERKRLEQVPIEQNYTDFYAVQHVTQYIPQVIPSKKIQYMPVERTQNRVEYHPIQRQVVYYHNNPQQYQRSQYYQLRNQHQYTQNIPKNLPQYFVHQPDFKPDKNLNKTSKFGYYEQKNLMFNATSKQGNYGLKNVDFRDNYIPSNLDDRIYKSPIQYSIQNVLPLVSSSSLRNSYTQYNHSQYESAKHQRIHKKPKSHHKHPHKNRHSKFKPL